MIDFILLPIPPPLEFSMKRFISLIVVVALSFSLCTFAFALDPDTTLTDGDFIRFACDTHLSLNSETFSFVVPFTTRSSVSSDRTITDLDFTCDRVSGLYGTFTYVFIVGSTSSIGTASEPVPLNVMTQSNEGYIRWEDTVLRKTDYDFKYKPSSTSYNCRAFIATFECFEGYSFVEAYMNASDWLAFYTGGSVFASFLLYSPTQNSVVSHLGALDVYMKLLVNTYIPRMQSDLRDMHLWQANLYNRLDDARSDFAQHWNDDNIDWEHFPTPLGYTSLDPFNALSYWLICDIREKATQQASQRPLDDLRGYQDELFATANGGLPSLLNGFRQVFRFFDISEAVSFSDVDLGMGLLGYTNYFGGDPPNFFSSATRSNLVVNNG